jgi:hypothetical protein
MRSLQKASLAAFVFLAVYVLQACTQPDTADLEAQAISYPIMFVTQVPNPGDFTTIASVFGNHKGTPESAPRGGDLWIRYPDGSLKNLTKSAGYGAEGFQGASSIAVRDPSVHWNGAKAVFSMVVGAPAQPFEVTNSVWQLYEISGLGKTETPVIRKIPSQPAYNNVSPIYASNDSLIFTSDRPRSAQAHLYPQLDEYESSPTVSGLWKLTGSRLELLDHAPSGDFDPFIDSFGRVVFTRWDHLQRDQQADTDVLAGGACTYCPTTFTGESAAAARVSNSEVFPEPSSRRTDLLAGTPFTGHSFNHFLPWMMNQDGTDLELLNHLGRHELQAYIPRSRNDDPNLEDFYGQYPRTNQNSIGNILQLSEDPRTPGRYIGIDAPEFTTHGSGQLIALNAPPSKNPDTVMVEYLSSRATAQPTNTPSPEHSGFYRNPVILSDGTVVASHAATTLAASNTGTAQNPKSPYAFRIKTVTKQGTFWKAATSLTPGIQKNVSYYLNGALTTYSGNLWELSPTEVRPYPRPSAPSPSLPSIEASVFQKVGVNLSDLQTYLRQKNLALVVSRNVTVRDDADEQQPYNLRVAGTTTTSSDGTGRVYDVSHLQFFVGVQVRGYEISVGRRVLARPMSNTYNGVATGGPAGSVVIASDGSMAAFVPARRALTWQLTAPGREGVVRERNWLTFQPGEVRVCASCHGVNNKSHTGTPDATNSPKALEQLLTAWKNR